MKRARFRLRSATPSQYACVCSGGAWRGKRGERTKTGMEGGMLNRTKQKNKKNKDTRKTEIMSSRRMSECDCEKHTTGNNNGNTELHWKQHDKISNRLNERWNLTSKTCNYIYTFDSTHTGVCILCICLCVVVAAFFSAKTLAFLRCIPPFFAFIFVRLAETLFFFFSRHCLAGLSYSLLPSIAFLHKTHIHSGSLG